MNQDYERNELPKALEELYHAIGGLLNGSLMHANESAPVPPLDSRKLHYVQFSTGADKQTPGGLNKSISQMLAHKRVTNDSSNRVEFLSQEDTTESAARVDAKLVDRDVMMKFDVARNDEGPLRRTIQSKENENGIHSRTGWPYDGSTRSEKQSGLEERLSTLETHFATYYVPSAPVSLFERLKLLEEHIINLEREFPPWSALHFNQPRRGWPPPPRSTPIIVPSHLTSSTIQQSKGVESRGETVATLSGENVEGKGKGRATSSLQRAVLERLEVQRAMADLHGHGQNDS